MPIYQVYVFADARHLAHREIVEFMTDHEACEHAAALMGNHLRAEVWERDRPVALIGNPLAAQ